MCKIYKIMPIHIIEYYIYQEIIVALEGRQ